MNAVCVQAGTCPVCRQNVIVNDLASAAGNHRHDNDDDDDDNTAGHLFEI